MNEIDAIEFSARRIQKVSRIFARIIAVLFWAAAAIMVFILLLLALGLGDEGSSLVQTASACIKYALEAVVTLLLLWVFKSFFRDMGMGLSPFTFAQSRKLKWAAALQIAHAILVTVTSPAILNVMGLDDAVLGVSVGAASVETAIRFVPVNVGDIVLAIVLFCAALIVEYGSLLQKLSDDTL